MKQLTLIILCLFMAIGQSENLPKKTNFIWESELKIDILEDKISSGNVRLISYNTMALPVELKGHEHKRRFDALPDSLFKIQADIIALQETFHPAFRKQLLRKLPAEYHVYSDYTCSRDIVPFVKKDCYGGLMTMSVYPITDETFYPYPITSKTSIIEKIGGKGFLVSNIRIGKKNILFVNTHLYAGDNLYAEERRMEQIKYMNAVLDSICPNKNCNLILSGDYNAHHPRVAASAVYTYITKHMGCTDSKPDITEMDYTSDVRRNRYVAKNEPRSKLDYIFFRMNKNFIPSFNISETEVTLTSELPLSDHFAWKATLQVK